MQSYNALADSAHAPVVVRSFLAAQHPSIVASSGAQRLTAAAAEWSEIRSTIQNKEHLCTFLWADLEFLDVHVQRVGDPATIDRDNFQALDRDDVSHRPQQEQLGFVLIPLISSANPDQPRHSCKENPPRSKGTCK